MSAVEVAPFPWAPGERDYSSEAIYARHRSREAVRCYGTNPVRFLMLTPPQDKPAAVVVALRASVPALYPLAHLEAAVRHGLHDACTVLLAGLRQDAAEWPSGGHVLRLRGGPPLFEGRTVTAADGTRRGVVEVLTDAGVLVRLVEVRPGAPWPAPMLWAAVVELPRPASSQVESAARRLAGCAGVTGCGFAAYEILPRAIRDVAGM